MLLPLVRWMDSGDRWTPLGWAIWVDRRTPRRMGWGEAWVDGQRDGHLAGGHPDRHAGGHPEGWTDTQMDGGTLKMDGQTPR